MSLLNTNFQSIYATNSPFEDWAEAFSLLISHQGLGLNYQVQAQGSLFDLTQHFLSPQLQSKRTFVEKFMQGTFLYPGETSVP